MEHIHTFFLFPTGKESRQRKAVYRSRPVGLLWSTLFRKKLGKNVWSIFIRFFFFRRKKNDKIDGSPSLSPPLLLFIFAVLRNKTNETEGKTVGGFSFSGLSRRDGIKIRFLSEDSSGVAELLVTVYGLKKDILFEKTAYEPRQTTQEVLKIWERNGIDVGEVATSSGVVVQNNGTGAKPPLSGPTSNNTIPQSPEKSSSNSENAETSRQTEVTVVGKILKKYSSACASYGGS